mgnify:CR=1 FL=1
MKFFSYCFITFNITSIVFIFFPDKFLAHAKPEEQYEEANLLAKDIVHTALQTLGTTKKQIDEILA